MLVLLPPSETKHPGGAADSRFDPGALIADEHLRGRREVAIDALVRLSASHDDAVRVLKLGAKLHGEVAVNAALRDAATMPAVDRYTGVLFDALDAASLDDDARSWLGAHVWIHSAPFGPVAALDHVPAYRLGAGISVPGLGSLRRHWADAVSSAIAAMAPPYVLDLRSEAYVALGPVPSSAPGDFVRVVTRADGGAVRALNHFNKHAKGELVRRLADDRPVVRSRADLLTWADGAGLDITVVGDELHLTV